MKKAAVLLFAILFLFSCKQAVENRGGYPIQQVNLTQVELTDSFWLPKIRTIQETTIRYAFDKCHSEGRLTNFVTAGEVMHGDEGKVCGSMPFDDTDVYKTIEGAAYSLINAPNPALEAYLDSVIEIIRTGQEPDGYLTTWRTISPANPPAPWVKSGGGRWFDLGSSHELYNSGHLFEAASAHYWATGKRNFLDIALRNADLLVKVFGDTANYEIPGHQIAETGLIKLYQITDNESYLKLAKKFLDLRGDAVHRQIRGAYSQDHLPVTQQDEVVGHAVRAVYMYAGMTDIAALYGDSAYRKAVNKLWENMVGKKMYITGGLGARHEGESFGDNYELPNLTAYSETCAAIGGVYWNERMFRLTGEARYFDVLERMLYNGVIAGISLEGTEFFYPNPLEADGKYAFNQGALTRQPWFDCSCCPTNLIRFIPYIPNLIYATQDNNLYVNLFMSNTASIALQGKKIEITQKTAYPWNGDIRMNISPRSKQAFTLKVRVPDWVLGQPVPSDLYTFADDKQLTYTVKVNGVPVESVLDKGYFSISRSWEQGDEVEVHFDMEPRVVKANDRVEADRGKISVERGPIVYCAEGVDNDFTIFNACLSPDPEFKVENNPELSGGIRQIQTTAQLLNDHPVKDVTLTLIPYYVWNQRGIGSMAVWLSK